MFGLKTTLINENSKKIVAETCWEEKKEINESGHTNTPEKVLQLIAHPQKLEHFRIQSIKFNSKN